MNNAMYTQPDLKQARGLKNDLEKRGGTQSDGKIIYTEYFWIGIVETLPNILYLQMCMYST